MTVRAFFMLCLLLPLTGAAQSLPPLEATELPAELDRFEGRWFVQASIPVDVPFFNDSGAYNYEYLFEPLPRAKARLTLAFNDSKKDGKRRKARLKTWRQKNTTQAIWKVQPVWPARFTFLVLHVAEDYSAAVVGVPSRRWAWIIAREKSLPEDELQELMRTLTDDGFDTSLMRRIVHTSEDTELLSP